jgi:hypothetical protein
VKGTWIKTAVWTMLFTGSVTFFQYADAADWFSTRAQAGQVARHEQALAGLTQEEHSALIDQARVYNARLALGLEGRTHEEHPDYLAMLNPEGVGIMGRVSIPALGVVIPIHHGTSDYVMDRAAGHQYGTYLDIVPGADLVTLFTCTPTGVNTHRLLVRGHRIPAPELADLVAYEIALEAGFPWWAAIISGTMLASIGSGRLLVFAPVVKKAADPKPSSSAPRHRRAAS